MTITCGRAPFLLTSLILCMGSPVRSAPPEVAPAPLKKPTAPEKASDSGKVWLTKLADGSAQARRRRQPLLVRIGSESCPWCRKLEAELRDVALLKELDRWTLVALDVSEADRDARSLAVGPVPALRLLTPDGRVVASRDGFLRAAELIEWLRKHHDAAAIVPAEELTATGVPEAAAITRLITELNQRDPALREAAIRRLLPHPQLAAKSVSDAFAKGSLQSRLAALELLREWQAPVQNLDPWRPETMTAPQLASLTKWAESPPAVKSATEKQLTAEELKSIRQELARLISSPDAEAVAIRERLARHGPVLLAEVYAAVKESGTDAARERLTALRYRLAAGDSLALQWPGGIDRLAAGKAAIRHEAVQELARRATPADEPLLLELFGNPDPFVRELSLRTLHTVAGRTATGALSKLLKDPDPNVRAAVLKQLAETPSPTVVPRIAEYLTGETDLDLVAHAVKVLRAAGGDAAVAQLKPLLKHASWRVRAEAVEAVAECAGNRTPSLSGPVKTEVHTAVREALTDTDGFVIGRAIGVLKKTAEEADIEPLVRAATTHPELAGEVVAALSNGSRFRDKVIPHLQKFCRHTDPAVRARAITALWTDGPDAAGMELRAGLTDPIATVRESTTRALFNHLENKRSNAIDNAGRNNNGMRKSISSEEVDKLIAEYREGKDRPKGLVEMIPLIERLLKADDSSERLEAALLLISLDRSKAGVPVLINAAQKDMHLVERASKALPWLPWSERLDLFGRLATLRPKGEALESLVRGFAQVPDVRATVPLWELAGRDGMNAAAAGEIAGALRQLAGGDRYDRPSATNPTTQKLIEDARAKARAGSEFQRLTALVVLAALDQPSAAEVAAALYKDAATAPLLRRDAFQVMLITQRLVDATAEAVKALSEGDAGLRRVAVQFLAIGADPLRHLRDKQIYLNVYDRSHHFFGRLNLSQYVPKVPAGLPRGVLRQLLTDPDPMTNAAAAYLLALLGDDSGLIFLVRYWRETARDERDWSWLVVMAIACLDDDSLIPIVEEVYREMAPKESDRRRPQEIQDLYWIIRPMGGPNALRLRKTIRSDVGLDALGLSN